MRVTVEVKMTKENHIKYIPNILHTSLLKRWGLRMKANGGGDKSTPS